MKLSFRKRGLSIENKKRIYFLLAVFAVAFVFFHVVLNYQGRQEATDMDSPTLPVVAMEGLGMQLSELHGYKKEMDAAYMRDAVVPLQEDRKLPIFINTDNYDIDEVSYEIRSLDTERKIAETKVTDYHEKDGIISKTLQIEYLVEEGQEYLFILTLTSGDEEIHYYTRIMLPVDCYEQECLDFAMNFHNTTLSDSYYNLAVYMETSGYANTDTLSHVGLDSSIAQIGWEGFDGTQVGEPVVEMKDITPNYCSLVMYYQMQRTNENGHVEFYNVEEYYKVRYATERMYMLDYQRDMEEVLNEDNISVASNVLDIGVAKDNVDYLSNETGTIVSFVQAGELFEYNQNTGELTKVFGFMNGDITDPRENYNEHNILILNIDESGTMDFVVYGYMNSGIHEGKCGVDLYHYDSSSKEATEQTFIESSKSYQILNANFSSLLYENSDGMFYVMLGGTLVKIDLDTLETEEIISGLTEEQYAVSKSGRYVAWMNENDVSDTIHLMDLENESTSELKAEKGQMLKPLAFMDEDFVYGSVNSSDIGTDTAGSNVFPMHEVTIVEVQSGDYDVLMSYQKQGFFVTDVSQADYTLYMTLVTRSGDTFVPADNDTIKNNSGEKNKAVNISGVADDSKGEVTKITMTEMGEGTVVGKMRYLSAGLVMADADKTISLATKETEDKYFVYVGSRVTLATEDITEAVIQADTEMGIVVDNKQQYIWKRGKKSYQNAFTRLSVGNLDSSANSSAQCISAMLVREGENVEVHTLLEQGETPMSVLQSTLKDTTVLDLTGCSLTQVLYYVGQGNPVYAVTRNQEAVLIVGYDAANATVFNPRTGTTSKIGLMDGTNMFAEAGNVFISYIK